MTEEGYMGVRSPFSFRPETRDETIFNDVNLYNEYKLPSRFQPNDIIIDIGMHIGSFCYAALIRGSNHVYGFEAELENYQCATANLKSFGNRVHLYHWAVWRSDSKDQTLFHSGYSADQGLWNTGGGNVLATSGQEVDTVAFDDIIWGVTDNGNKRVRLVKIDVEGSEFPILLTSRSLNLVDSICGEYHEFGGEYDEYDVLALPVSAQVPGYDRYTIVELTGVLNRAGFEVESLRLNKNIGMFFAMQL
jgi:FkbM family methyltransferase